MGRVRNSKEQFRASDPLFYSALLFCTGDIDAQKDVMSSPTEQLGKFTLLYT
jgi:hypothetical protein